MKKIFTTVVASMMLLPGVANAEETSTTSLDNVEETTITNETIDTQSTETLDVEFVYDSLTLIKEEYNGTYLIRWMEWEEQTNDFVQIFEVPESIQKQVDIKDEDVVAKVTALLAQYYSQDSVNNIVRLNELLFAYSSIEPNSKFSVSKEYEHTFAENLKFTLEAVSEEKNIKITDEEIELLNQNTFGSADSVPHSSKEELYKATEELYEELKEKWYEKTSTYIIFGGAILIIAAFILLKRR